MVPVVANFGSFWQWAILFTIVLLVFGAKRLPDVARNLGKSLGEFKKARREFEEELMKADESSRKQVPAPQSVPVTPMASAEKQEKTSEEASDSKAES